MYDVMHYVVALICATVPIARGRLFRTDQKKAPWLLLPRHAGAGPASLRHAAGAAASTRCRRRFAALYTRPDGSLRYLGQLTARDGADDFLETFFNWPQLYLLGGASDLLEASARHWHGVVGQLTGLGMYRDEFEIGYDWFHQGESMLFFYFLTLADPDRWRDRAVRFAELYVDPASGNYDPELGIIRAPHNGSGGARDGLADAPSYPWTPEQAAQYGYPLDWLVPSGSVAPPLDADPRLGAEMRRGMGSGDVVGNLGAAGLVFNAFLVTGAGRYADWLAAYVGGWQRRAAAHAQARRRLALMEAHAGDSPGEEDIYLWQNLNPVVTEALTQLTWGAPQVLYNGGPVQARVRYYDGAARRPGLPPDVAALVSSVDPAATVVTLVNLAGAGARSVVVQAGAFGQHDIESVAYEGAEPGWAGSDTEYISRDVRATSAAAEVGGPWLEVRLPAGTQVTLTLRLRAGARLPSVRTPWGKPGQRGG